MTENPIIEVLQRIMRLAQRDGTVYCKIVWDPTEEVFNFTPLLAKFVEVHYEEKRHD